MKDEHRYTELTKADTLNRLTYLVQLHKDRANDESTPSTLWFAQAVTLRVLNSA